MFGPPRSEAATEHALPRRGEVGLALLRARSAPVCVIVLDSPAIVLPTVYPGFRREAAAHPGLRTVARSAG